MATPSETISPRRVRTRERLLDAAFDVFAQHGVQAASIEAICDAADFTRGAFYSNFASKEELFLALTERETRVQLARLEEAAVEIDPSTVRADIRDAVRCVVASVMPDPAAKRAWSVMALEFELLALRDPAVAARYAEQDRRLREELADALTRLVADIGLRFAVDPHLAVDLLLGAFESGQRTALLAGGEERATALVEALVDLLVTPAG